MLSQKNTYMRMMIFSFFVYTNYAAVNPHFSLIFKLKGFKPSLIGIIMSLFFVGGAIGPLVFSKLAQYNKGYRGVFFIVYTGLILGSFAILNTNKLLLLAILVVGMGACMYSLAPMTDAACTSLLHNPYKEYGIVRAVGTIGYIMVALTLMLFPFIIDITSQKSILQIISIIATVGFLISFLLPKHDKNSRTLLQQHGAKQTTSLLSDIKEMPISFYILLLLVFFNFSGLGSLVAFLPLLLTNSFNINNVTGVWLFASSAELLGLFYGQRMVSKLGYAGSMGIVLCATVLRLVLLALSNSILQIYFFVQPLHILSFALAVSCLVNFINTHIPTHIKTSAFSFVQLSITLGRVLVISIGGIILQHYGFTVLFFAIAGFVAMGLVILFLSRKHLIYLSNSL